MDTVVLEIFAGIRYCVSAYFNDIQKKIVIFNTALANQNHNNQKECMVLINVLLNFAPFYQPAIVAKLNFIALR